MTSDDVSPIPSQLLAVGDGPVFLLKMPDNAMTSAGIAFGEWVIVRQCADPADKTIVAATIDGNATVRTFRCYGDSTWLEAHGGGWPNTPGAAATVLGRVTAVIHPVK